MRPLSQWPAARRRAVRVVLSDIDDTLSDDGRLPPRAYRALDDLANAGFRVIPVTGRPAGWCDMIARFWPVAAVVGENGALCYRYDQAERRMHRQYWDDAASRAAHRCRLDDLAKSVLAAVPGAGIAADQPFRIADLAIDIAEDVPRLPAAEIERILGLCAAAGANAKLSSIHVNAWFGAHDKLSMTRRLLADAFALDVERDGNRIAFIGDSPNDAPMFAAFANAIGVRNVLDHAETLPAHPAYVTDRPGSRGFVAFAKALLAARA